MAGRTRSDRAPKAEIDEILEPPVLATRNQIAPGLEIWKVKLKVSYHEFGHPEERKELADLTIRLLVGRCPNRETSVRPPDVMLVEFHCITDRRMQGALIKWAQEEWAKFYPQPADDRPTIVEWSGPLHFRLIRQALLWADRRVEQFHDARIYDAAGLEWNVGRWSPKLSVYRVTAAAKVSSGEPDQSVIEQQVEIPVVLMVDDPCSNLTDQSEVVYIFCPTMGLQIGYYHPATQVCQLTSRLNRRPEHEDFDDADQAI